MLKNFTAFVFFANYFIGILAIALSIETLAQLHLPLNSFPYYLLIFSATVFYYTIAYSSPPGKEISSNPRTEWYRTHHQFIRASQYFFFAACVVISGWLLVAHFPGFVDLPVYWWLMMLLICGAAVLYYGLLPKSVISFNLRNTGWLKAFVIGFVWAGFVNVFPVAMLKIEHGTIMQEPAFMLWLFVKNWMVMSANAIMFDMKDYEDDANIQLKTFAVAMGLRNTIFYVLIPLLSIGLLSFLTLAYIADFSPVTVFFNFIPFVSYLLGAFTLQKPKSVLFYLIVIDGLLLVKAICGISGSFFTASIH